MEITLAASGKVTAAHVAMPGIDSRELALCLEDVARRLRFPRHADRELRFAFPLVYRKG
jgi:hypothetical protein